ncbi:hypothetical protein TNCV_438341 [Trichonephila clavipes]|nr:hypothetical protein TNCV_438341 [Trichonephila clavipes]
METGISLKFSAEHRKEGEKIQEVAVVLKEGNETSDKLSEETGCLNTKLFSKLSLLNINGMPKYKPIENSIPTSQQIYHINSNREVAETIVRLEQKITGG